MDGDSGNLMMSIVWGPESEGLVVKKIKRVRSVQGREEDWNL